MECLDSVVGLTKNESICHEDGRPIDFNESKSGYFIDDPEYGISLRQAGASGEGMNLWQLLAHVREAGIQEFVTDFGILTNENNRRVFRERSVRIGAPHKATIFEGISSPNIGMRLKGKDSLAQRLVLEVTKVGVYLDSEITTDIRVYSSQNGYEEPIYTSGVSSRTNRNTVQGLSEPWHLELNDDKGNAHEFVIVYDSQGSTPKKVIFQCCGSGRFWTSALESYEGVEFDDTSDLSTPTGVFGTTGGLTLYGSIKCDEMAFICDSYNFESNPWARVMAKCIQLSGIQKLITTLLNTTNLNRFTIMDKGDLETSLEMVTEEREHKLRWLAMNLPNNANCWLCQQGQRTMMAEINV